jgi:hypothetical protein
MTKSIKTDDSGRVETIFNGEKSGDGWTQIPDSEWPEVTESNVSVEYHHDGSQVTVTTEPNPEDEYSL